nr:sperm activating peptide III [Clypeaster japonicus]prf//1708180K sperm activating peptide III [Astriclypeus mannii]
DTDSAHLIG